MSEPSYEELKAKLAELREPTLTLIEQVGLR